MKNFFFMILATLSLTAFASEKEPSQEDFCKSIRRAISATNDEIRLTLNEMQILRRQSGTSAEDESYTSYDEHEDSPSDSQILQKRLDYLRGKRLELRSREKQNCPAEKPE